MEACCIFSIQTEYRETDNLEKPYGTIGYEVVCGINKRVDRIYI